MAERVRGLVEEATHLAGLPATVSIGVFAHRGGDATPDGLVALADEAASPPRRAAGTRSRPRRR